MNLGPGEQEATDQPPPIHAPLTPRQVRGLVIPAVLFVLLLTIVVWGIVSTMPAPAALGQTRSSQPESAGQATPSATVPARTPVLQTATPPVAVSGPSPALQVVAPSATAGGQALTSPPSTPAATISAQPPAGQSVTPSTAPADPSPPPTPSPPPGLPLQGRRIGLDPGHGPREDLGAVLVDANTGRLILSEDELNLDVALRCAAILRARGAQVVLTRETKDAFSAPWPPDTNGDGIKGGEADDLQERIDIVNAFHAEVLLSIHANSSADPAKRQGIQALYCASADCPFPAQERHLGALVLNQLKVKLAAAGDPVQRSELRDDLWPDYPGGPSRHLFLLGPVDPPRHVRAALMPGLVIESLYVTSPEEAAQLKQGPVRQAIALAYADALQEYLLGSGS